MSLFQSCLQAALYLGVACVSAHTVFAQASPSPALPHALELTGDVSGAHDPSMIHAGGTWYVFTTGKAADGGELGIRCSTDLRVWRGCGHVFSGLPSWIQQRSPQTKDLWAPDISFEHGEFRLYYAYSTFGKNTSGIALATNTTLDQSSPEYVWKDKGLVLESKPDDNFNAIDPNYIQDAQGHAWLAFGSFWSGIKLRALDAATGMLSTADLTVYSLAARTPTIPQLPAQALPPNTQAIEAPFIFRHGSYYYLFTSFDLCCRGTRSTYRTMVGRSKTVTGPYTDRAGQPLLQGGGTELLVADTRWIGPGGASVVAGHPDYLVFHAYDSVTGKPSLQLSTITWHAGWPQAALAR